MISLHGYSYSVTGAPYSLLDATYSCTMVVISVLNVLIYCCFIKEYYLKSNIKKNWKGGKSVLRPRLSVDFLSVPENKGFRI